MSYRLLRFLLLGVSLLLIASQSALADNVYAAIRGTVTDPSGAVVQGADITAKNTETGIQSTTKSNSTGFYQFLQLPVGTYTVSVSKQGFKAVKSTPVTVAVNQVYDLPIALTVGTASETVEVRANAVQVETTDIQQKTVIGSQQIVDLPLNGRNFVQLSQLAPGVMASSDRFNSNYATNGSQSQQNAYLINGTDSNDIPLNTPGLIPSPDAIQEFNLITSTINPEYGRNSGGIVNAVIKSGTNQWHGGIFDFYRDTFLNSRGFFSGPDAPVFHQNQFGGTFGGPVFKDKTFFFLSYQGTYNRVDSNTLGQSAAQSTTVLSANQRAGIFNGFTVSPATFDPIAVALMNKYVPLPNAPGNQFVFNPVNTGKTDQGIARIDHNFNSSNQIWGVFAENNNRATQALPFTGSTLPGFGTFSTANTKEITIAYNHTFSNTTLNEVRLGWHRLNFDTVDPQQLIDPKATYGFNINVQNPKAAQLPVMAVTGLFTLGFSDNGPQPRKDSNYQFTDNFSKIVGKHSLKFGFDGRRFQVDNPFFFLIDGHYDFDGSSTGDPAADFLLGLPADYAQGSGAVINARAYEYYAYGQDQWKVKSNLTLTFGAGYEIDTPYNNNQYGGKAFNCFIPGEQSTVFPTAPKGMTYPGDPGCKNSGADTKYGHFGPRFGFAYSPTWGGRVTRGAENKTSVRGGFGIYFNRYEEETALQNLADPPFGLTSFGAGDFPVGGTPTFKDPWTDIGGGGTVANKFPFTPFPLGSAVDFTNLFEPLSLSTVSPSVSTPYAMNFNLNIQREFAGNTVFSIGYVGALGRKLFRAYEGDPFSLAGQTFCRNTQACGGTSRRNNPELFYPQFTPGNNAGFGSWGTQFTDGTSNYSSLQVNVTKGLSHGLQLITSYTWSHAIDNGSGFENSGFFTRGTNPFFPNLNVGDSGFDARQRLVIGYLYQIPSLHKIANWAPEKIFGGWKMTGITTFQGGFPINISSSSQGRALDCSRVFSFYGCPDNPNQVVASVKTLDPRNSSFLSPVAGKVLPNYWFDPSGFAQVPRCIYVAGVVQNANVCGQFGNTGRDSLHGPGIDNSDFSFQKDTSITERLKFQMGLDMFNLFNHTNFNNPSNNVNSGNFGRITSAAPARILQLRFKFNF